MTHILSVGYDPHLMATRSMVLRSRGYAVEEAYSLAKAFQGVQSDAIDLLLICHTVSAEDRNKLITLVRSVRRLLPILCITAEQFPQPTDGCVRVTSSPVELLDAVLLAASHREGILSSGFRVEPGGKKPSGRLF
jgi:CheY-like chemotaxis protein